MKANPNRTTRTAEVRDLMTERVFALRATDDLEALYDLMDEHHIRHVPVVAGERLTGIISIGDVVKSRIGELEFERDQLDSYVHRT